MKRLGIIGLMIATLAACGPKDAQVQRTKDEKGTEIVLNKIEPLRSKGSPASLELTEEWSLNTGDDATASFGLADIGLFDIDSRGNVYFAASRSHEKAILKFDSAGRPAAAFGRRGQGPGEIQDVGALFLTSGDEAAVTNAQNNRLTVFGEDGSLVREMPVFQEAVSFAPLPNGAFFVKRALIDPKAEVLFEYPLELFGPDLKVRAKLDTGIIENPMTGERLRGTYHLQSWSVTRNLIFTGHQDRGYDIFVYDFEGRPVRKIRKEFKPIPVSDAYKKEFLKQFESPNLKIVRDKVYFPGDMPPFIGFAADEAGRLFVMTYETTDRPGEFIFDVFNPEGEFILRKPIRVYHDFNGTYFKVRNDRFYCVQESESGEKIFRVFRMAWK